MTLISEGEWIVLPKYGRGGGRGTDPILRLTARSDGTGKRLIGNVLATRLLPTRVAILIHGDRLALRAVKPEDPGTVIRKVSSQKGVTCVIAATGLPGSLETRFKIVPNGDLFLLQRMK